MLSAIKVRRRVSSAAALYHLAALELICLPISLGSKGVLINHHGMGGGWGNNDQILDRN